MKNLLIIANLMVILTACNLVLTRADRDGVAIADSEPRVTRDEPALNVSPLLSYPEESRKAGEQGEVRLRVLVGDDGAAREVRFERSSGFSRLDEAAIDAVRTWRFHSMLSSGRRASGWLIIPIRFSLKP